MLISILSSSSSVAVVNRVVCLPAPRLGYRLSTPCLKQRWSCKLKLKQRRMEAKSFANLISFNEDLSPLRFLKIALIKTILCLCLLFLPKTSCWVSQHDCSEKAAPGFESSVCSTSLLFSCQDVIMKIPILVVLYHLMTVGNCFSFPFKALLCWYVEDRLTSNTESFLIELFIFNNEWSFIILHLIQYS